MNKYIGFKIQNRVKNILFNIQLLNDNIIRLLNCGDYYIFIINGYDSFIYMKPNIIFNESEKIGKHIDRYIRNELNLK